MVLDKYQYMVKSLKMKILNTSIIKKECYQWQMLVLTLTEVNFLLLLFLVPGLMVNFFYI